MKTTMLAIAASMAAGALAHAQDAVQWRVEDGGNGHWYQLRGAGSNQWASEQAVAVQLGGYLSTITSDSERLFLQSMIPDQQGISGFGAAFMGMYQDTSAPDYSEPAGGWVWVTGEPTNPWPFGGGEPNNAGGGQNWAFAYIGGIPTSWYLDDWRPGTCCTPCCSLIEWSADCNGDDIVDYGQILDGTLEDANENGVPDCCDEGVSCDPCLGDVNNDGQVNGADISVLLGFWGLNGKPLAADINQDGSVDGADLAQLLGSWGECP